MSVEVTIDSGVGDNPDRLRIAGLDPFEAATLAECLAHCGEPRLEDAAARLMRAAGCVPAALRLEADHALVRENRRHARRHRQRRPAPTQE